MNKKIIHKIQRQITLKQNERNDMIAYDDIVAMRWDGISSLADKDWYVEFKDPTGRDLIQQAVNIYATQQPKFNVLPLGPNDADRAEEYERFLEWHMAKLNEMGEKPVHSMTLTHSTKYNRICSQLEYRPYWDESEEAKVDPFCEKVYLPHGVYYEFGATELQWVAVVQNMYAVDVLEHWGGYGEDEEVKGPLAKIQELVDDDDEIRLMYIDYTDKEKREVRCYKVNGEEIDETLGEENEDVITILDRENKLGFINWAISSGEGDPLLAPLHHGDMWLNANKSGTMQRTTAYKNAFYPSFIEEGSGEETSIDYSGDVDKAVVPPGKRLTPIPPRVLDPAFSELFDRDRNMMTTSVGIGNTASTQAANVQFATINALIQLKLAQLDPYKRTWERHRKQIARLMFRWMKKEDATLTAYRTKSKKPDDAAMQRGSNFTVSAEDYEMGDIFIECELLPNNPTDLMQRVNMFITMRNGGAPMAWKEIFERLQMGEGEINVANFEDEQIWQAVLAAMTKKIQGEADLEIQQAAMAMQQAALQAQQTQQGAEPPQQGPPQPVMQGARGNGFNANAGGGAPAEMSPQMTQTQVQGQDVTGAGI